MIFFGSGNKITVSPGPETSGKQGMLMQTFHNIPEISLVKLCS
jgi:anthranilate/para-aminobenzoate synthase component II